MRASTTTARLLLSAVGVAMLMPGLTLGFVGSAAASTFTPPGLPVVNVLPSTVIGAAGRGLSSPEALVLMMKAGSVDAPVWKMVTAANAAKAAGTATSTELALVAKTAQNFAAPATKFGTLAKVAGPATVVMTGLQLGLSAGDTASRILGFKDSMVCTEQNGVLSAVSALTNHVDCGAFENTMTKAQQDYDAAASWAAQKVCDTLGYCLQLNGAGGIDDAGNPAIYYCVAQSGAAAAADGVGRLYLVLDSASHPRMSDYYHAAPGPFLRRGQCPSIGYLRGDNVNPGEVAPNVISVQLGSGPVVPTDVTRDSPDRTWQCKITNTDGSSATKFSKTFVETGSFAVPECPSSDPGKVPDTVEIGESTGGTLVPMITQPTTPEWKQSRTDYPLCGTGLCGLELTPTATPTITCHQDPTACAGWFKDPSKTSKFKCTYGPYDVAITQCTTYAPTFEPDAPATGQTLGDPETGAAGPQTSPTDDGAPGSALDANGQCFPSGWGILNPVEWVLKPVKCAIEWAFIPAPAHVASVQAEMSTAVDETPPGKIRTFVVGIGWPTALNGCSGLDLDLSGWKPLMSSGGLGSVPGWNGHTSLLAACEGDILHPWAVGTFVVLTAVVAFGGIRTAIALAGRMFGYVGASGD